MDALSAYLHLHHPNDLSSLDILLGRDTIMFYTVGNTENYLAAMEKAKPNPLLKVGKGGLKDDPDYIGGIIFPTIFEATKYLVQEKKADVWSIFVVDCGFGDCYFSDKSEHLHLLHDAPIIQIVDAEYCQDHI